MDIEKKRKERQNDIIALNEEIKIKENEISKLNSLESRLNEQIEQDKKKEKERANADLPWWVNWVVVIMALITGAIEIFNFIKSRSTKMAQ